MTNKHFKCIHKQTSEMEELESLVEKGLMYRRKPNSDLFGVYVYHATVEGMKLVRMTKKAIKECSKELYGRK